MGDSYVDYETALESCGLQSLSDRREKRCLDFSLKCIKHPRNRRLFPQNTYHNTCARNSETFTVNFARTENYLNSAVPYCQRLLNDDHRQEQERRRMRKEQAGHQGREGAMARREG